MVPVVDVDMRPERRAAIADAVADALRKGVPGSEVQLRGSLATGEADRFSDIDLLWTVPGDRFVMAVTSVPEVLAAVASVDSLRSDPDFEYSMQRRLLFIRLAGLPLFWRIDLDIRASATDEQDVDASSAPVVATEWSQAASAVANGVAAIKAVLRRQPAEATGLLERGFARVGETLTPDEDWAAAIVRLAESAAAVDSDVAPFAHDVAQLAIALLPTIGCPAKPGGASPEAHP